jgi:hypothetical protein
MMSLRAALQAEAERRSLWPGDGHAHTGLSALDAFVLVRDMPYARASSYEPATVIREWRGTCSGKHYLLKEVFHEMGLRSHLMACTHRLTLDDAGRLPSVLRPLLEQGPFLDVHTYLMLDTEEAGSIVVDATWPLSARAYGLPVNDWGPNMQIACRPLETYRVPDDEDPQRYKERILEEQFSEAELRHRDRFIHAISSLGCSSP